MKIFLLIFPFLCFCQSVKVDYLYTTDEYANKETLITNQDSSYYFNQQFEGINKNEDKIDGTEITLVQKSIKLNKIEYFQNRFTPLLRFQLKYKAINRLIVDSLPTLKWKIDKNLSKKINGYNCNKAYVSFRGRDYEAWFTPEIPISFGPFKFKGLPGLILSISSIDGNSYNSWVATNITTQFKTDEKPQLCKDCLKMTMKEYVEFKQEIRENANKASIARLPKGYSNVKTSFERLSIERIFEWETEDEEKK